MCEDPEMKHNLCQFHENDTFHKEKECTHVLQSCTVTSSKAKRRKTSHTKISSQGGSCLCDVASRELNLRTWHRERMRGYLQQGSNSASDDMAPSS